MKVAVLGTGYLGAVHAACMAAVGHDVVGFDVDQSKIDLLSQGRSPFWEPEFETVLRDALESGRLSFTTTVAEAVEDADVQFVCVGTPQLPGSDAADLRYVDAAVQSILDHATGDTLIVGKSTVPVGTGQKIAERISATVTDGRVIEVAWNPEFLREGMAVQDTLRPDRLVFGVSSAHAEKVLRQVYASVLDLGTPCVTTDIATAEMVKVAANSFLATKISFVNAMAEVCEAAGADVVTLSEAIGYDDRIGRKFLGAGLGFGGGCLPKDIRAFAARAGELGAADALSFLREVDKINMRRRDKAVATASTMVGGTFLGSNIAVLGAAFKPNSDDVRDSPALNVAAAMHLKGAQVRVHDPKASENARRRFPTLTYCDTVAQACENADLIVLATEWSEYKSIDPDRMREEVRVPRLLDTRNALDHEFWLSCGWQVSALGRGALDG